MTPTKKQIKAIYTDWTTAYNRLKELRNLKDTIIYVLTTEDPDHVLSYLHQHGMHNVSVVKVGADPDVLINDFNMYNELVRGSVIDGRWVLIEGPDKIGKTWLLRQLMNHNYYPIREPAHKFKPVGDDIADIIEQQNDYSHQRYLMWDMTLTLSPERIAQDRSFLSAYVYAPEVADVEMSDFFAVCGLHNRYPSEIVILHPPTPKNKYEKRYASLKQYGYLCCNGITIPIFHKTVSNPKMDLPIICREIVTRTLKQSEGCGDAVVDENDLLVHAHKWAGNEASELPVRTK